jgi:hypothetical protein
VDQDEQGSTPGETEDFIEPVLCSISLTGQPLALAIVLGSFEMSAVERNLDLLEQFQHACIVRSNSSSRATFVLGSLHGRPVKKK